MLFGRLILSGKIAQSSLTVASFKLVLTVGALPTVLGTSYLQLRENTYLRTDQIFAATLRDRFRVSG